MSTKAWFTIQAVLILVDALVVKVLRVLRLCEPAKSREFPELKLFTLLTKNQVSKIGRQVVDAVNTIAVPIDQILVGKTTKLRTSVNATPKSIISLKNGEPIYEI